MSVNQQNAQEEISERKVRFRLLFSEPFLRWKVEGWRKGEEKKGGWQRTFWILPGSRSVCSVLERTGRSSWQSRSPGGCGGCVLPGTSHGSPAPQTHRAEGSVGLGAWSPHSFRSVPWPGPSSSFSKDVVQGHGDTLGHAVAFPAQDSIANRILKAMMRNGWAEVWVFPDGSLERRFL